jgi:signal transduction histidine kinase
MHEASLEGAMHRSGVISKTPASVRGSTLRIAAALFLAVAMTSWTCACVHAAEPKRVMLLHSFGRDFKPWSDYARSIRAELERQSPWPVDITDHSLVSARSSDEDPEPAFVNYLHALFARRPPDLIVSIGAPAAAFVQRHRERLFAETPMVFTAVEQRRVQPERLTANDTVVPVHINYFAALQNILHVLPDTKAITVVVGTSPIEKFWKEAIAKEAEPLANRVAFMWTDELSFEGLLKHAAALPPRSAIFWELMIVDAAGVVHEGDTPLTRLHAVANAPIFSYDESFFGREIVGGPLLLVADTSRQTAAVAVRILGGEKPADITTPPVEFAPPMFDWREMQRWGIGERRLPPGSRIFFRNPTIWEQYRGQFITVAGVLLMQAALIGWLLYEHWRRQVAEARALQQMHELARINRITTAGQLSASIAHEIRQPLASIASAGSAALNWLSGKVPDLDEARAAMRMVISQTHRADDVIKSVRAMCSHESTVRTEIDLNELVLQVLTLGSRSIAYDNILLNTRLADDPPPLVLGDAVQLQQVILNLINNAIEAMAGSNALDRILDVETRIGPTGTVFLTVADSGPGFDAKVAANMFTPFVTTKPQGMGMGLSICKSIVEQHGGQLTAVSLRPRGALLTIALPAVKAKAADARHAGALAASDLS